MKATYPPRFILFFVFIILAPLSVSAQSTWNAGETPKEISVQVFSGSFKNTLPFQFSGTGFIVTGRIGIRETKSLILQLPYFIATNRAIANSYFYSTGFERKEQTIGNLYIGLETTNPNTGYTTNFGVYLPTIGNNKPLSTLFGIFTDLDHYESGAPNFLSIALRVNRQLNSGEGFGMVTRLGVTGMVNTKTSTGADDFEGLLSYAAQPTFRSGDLDVVCGFSGKMIVTESADLSERVMHQVGLSISYTVNQVRFGGFIRVPVNKTFSDILENAYGGSLTYEF